MKKLLIAATVAMAGTVAFAQTAPVAHHPRRRRQWLIRWPTRP